MSVLCVETGRAALAGNATRGFEIQFGGTNFRERICTRAHYRVYVPNGTRRRFYTTTKGHIQMNDTNKPLIAAKKPAKVDLKAGEKYFWCRCGRSASQPFCDGSHRGTTMTPLAVSVEEDTEAFL